MEYEPLACQFWPGLAAPWRCLQTGFVAMWFFVGMVSAYDGWLVVKYWESIQQLERNPVCKYLIELGNGDSSIFVRAKASGTLAVLSVLASLYRAKPRLAMPVAVAISLFQLGLLFHLTGHFTALP